jgi:hypothetical protein
VLEDGKQRNLYIWQVEGIGDNFEPQLFQSLNKSRWYLVRHFAGQCAETVVFNIIEVEALGHPANLLLVLLRFPSDKSEFEFDVIELSLATGHLNSEDLEKQGPKDEIAVDYETRNGILAVELSLSKLKREVFLLEF